MFSVKDIKETALFILVTIIVVLPIRIFVAQPFVVSGTSMYPTFDTGHYLIVDQITYKFSSPKRGDVVVFKYPEDTSKYFIKRIIGLPGETVEIKDNVVKIIKENDGNVIEQYLEEPYVKLQSNNISFLKLNDNEYFVMGDNRSASLDSRFWGPLDKEFIKGRALIRITPVKKIGILPGDVNFNF
ncbi:MAG TPA: signal peptidase I [Candidatus Paceibacterota bacterium]|nr:signal peptidase I [Candidatus Paceibacterota bacterium]HMP18839.1 signal peptidase I [Candidatus Paceibacterota bacterium]HMP85369.1 signal peptidase I [Candidatus Paceibacterota bacterium]